VNRPVEALIDLQKSIVLNDNRAVYLSRLLIDEDLAARGAAAGRIYRELGFQQQALVEGWKSLSQDPTDYTAHRLLADSYSVLPRHEIARVSELLQSQLLQPINITPVQPQLAESDLFLLGGLGPAEPSLNEFNSLFQRNQFSLLASGLVGSNDTYSDEVVHSGIWNNFSYSLGQFHYETDGFRTNNDLDTDIYSVFAQGRLSPYLSMQAEFRHREAEHGDLSSHFAPDQRQIGEMLTSRRTAASDSYRVGFHLKPALHSNLVASVIYQDTSFEQTITANRPKITTTAQGYIAEIQYVSRSTAFDVALGGGYYETGSERVFGVGCQPGEECTESFNTQHGNGYIYTYIRYPNSFMWTLGTSVDWFNDDELGGLNSVNPKVGLLWNLTPDTTLRLGALKVLKRALIANQTVEPTHIAGFNQFFDDPDGTESIHYGIGIDHHFTSNLRGGFEASKRDLDVPVTADGTTFHDREESLYRGYLNWTPSQSWVTAIEYLQEDFDNNEKTLLPLDTETQLVPASIAYFSPWGIFAKLRISYLNQEVGLNTGTDSDTALLIDGSLGYRLSKRRGIFEIQVQNLLDEDFRYEGSQDRSPLPQVGVPSFTPFIPELAIFARMSIAL
jgi:hypothetical protein